jgi:diadenosine tetraphosphate (Ap4A) HIT family hydrolase
MWATRVREGAPETFSLCEARLAPMPTLIHRRVEALRRGDYPLMIARMASGWAVLGDPQVRPGYALLYPDPVTPHLNALTPPQRAAFLADMTRLGDAVLMVTGAVRVNYEILGNLEPALHAHVVPRHDEEPEALRTKPIWFYNWAAAPAAAPDLDASQRALRDALRVILTDGATT